MDAQKKKRLSIGLTLAMVFAMIMGPGPGLRLVNPDITAPAAPYIVFGIPVIYAWGIFWFVVQLVIVVTAYRTVWVDEDESAIDPAQTAS